ncbi:Hypothetical protein PHPALM_17826 [Phytophthora palmivora]|uniref:Uncharacterized protein n=1 Tax=Phytophthora palmivora TaxID=4796 RepID=A0A2P4XLB6_9STRA|nr:Hypothetical protein PHPALM_17826 [Phytophthora palmivora]
MFSEKLRAPRMSALHVAPLSVPWFKSNHSWATALLGNGIEAASLRKIPEDRDWLFPVCGFHWESPENTTT